MITTITIQLTDKSFFKPQYFVKRMAVVKDDFTTVVVPYDIMPNSIKNGVDILEAANSDADTIIVKTNVSGDPERLVTLRSFTVESNSLVSDLTSPVQIAINDLFDNTDDFLSADGGYVIVNNP